MGFSPSLYPPHLPLPPRPCSVMTSDDVPVCRYHQYKFIVDGEWRHDESQPFMPDPLGNVNNWLFVRRSNDPQQQHPLQPPPPQYALLVVTVRGLGPSYSHVCNCALVCIVAISCFPTPLRDSSLSSLCRSVLNGITTFGISTPLSGGCLCVFMSYLEILLTFG